MRKLLSTALRFLSRLLIWDIKWAISQGQHIANRKLMRKLNAIDPGTVSLYGHITIQHPHNCRLWRHVAIHDAEWNAEGGITIGDHVHFGPRVTIPTVSHNYEGQGVPYDETFVLKPAIIEDNVWVGSDVVIAPGTHIDEGCVIAMGTTIAGRILKGSIAGSAKWRTLKTRDMDKYEALKADGKFL